MRVLHHSLRRKTLESSFRFAFAATFGVDKHREAYIDKVPFKYASIVTKRRLIVGVVL